MEWDRPMTWGEIWRAIRGGDTGVLIATVVELAIMLSPVLIVAGALYAQS